ncbi:ADP-ribosylation factor-like protein 13B isoform X2 [Daktulosphaira vitifoliae]|uniref:ADP-ribosylation factor-like protein 13B isoform X2 n=1 Tax=Daktulosphaira vitifoliae TaxID=58002 RepID=UPI0021AAB7E5|nr:ADP-ribosylation factor-like protein 13B isoform X2 [Daktulosphaira vitifoliae]
MLTNDNAEKQKNVLPTVGFSSSKLFYQDFDITIYDLGGHKQIRDIWPQYFIDVHGVIFVVDSTAHSRLVECKEVFKKLLENDKISGKPVLLFANKQDKQGALDELDIVEQLNVEMVVNTNKSPTLVETCTAQYVAPIHYCSSAFIDPCIDSGFSWLVSQIGKHYDTLNTRVTHDMAQYQEGVNKRLEEWKNKQQTSNDSYLLSFNAPHRRSTKRNPFRRINRVIDSFESKLQNHSDGFGSTSFIIPLREEPTDPAAIAFRNKVGPIVSSSRSVQEHESNRQQISRSPLFRARSKEFENDVIKKSIGVKPEPNMNTKETEKFIRKESISAKLKRSMFSRSSSAGKKSSSAQNSERQSSAKSSQKSSQNEVNPAQENLSEILTFHSNDTASLKKIETSIDIQ